MQEIEGTKELNTEKTSILKFGTEWCGSCRIVQKKLETIEPDFPDFDFRFLDVDKHMDLADEYKINELPVVIAFKKGKEISRWDESVGDIENWLKFLTL